MTRITFDVREDGGYWISWKVNGQVRRLKDPVATRADAVTAITKVLTFRRAANRSRIRRMSPQRTLKNIVPRVVRRRSH